MPSDPRFATVLPENDLSPRIHQTRIIHDVLTPMRDGVMLAMDLIRPVADGAYPVVLVRTPYDKVAAREPFLRELAERGYIVAIQDVRGRSNSDGEFFPYRTDRADGYDTVAWVNDQAWCDGNIGMWGGSYVGQTQWFAAADMPPGLKTIVPVVSPPDAFLNEPICNGCFLLPMGEWMTWMGRRQFAMTGSEGAPFTEMNDIFHALPIAGLPERGGHASAWWDEMMQHPNWDDFWRSCSYQEAWSQIAVPALNITGWWDMNFPGSWLNYEGMRTQGPTEEVRDRQRLLIGPWSHLVNQHRGVNGLDFGDETLVNLDAFVTRWFDHWLKGIDNGVEADPRLTIFVLGANEWRTYADWPVPGSVPTPFYLHSDGAANTLLGDGGLSLLAPDDEPSDEYDYDPNDPVTSVWKIADGPVDDRLLSIRDDVLCYTSDMLTEPVEAIGRASVVLYASSSARDTDWHVRLCDVYPDGAARFLAHGMLRARFRETFEKPHFLEPNEVYRFEFGLDAVGVRFQPGHRIRVEITSSWFPEYDRNTNSGAANNFLDDQFVVATNRIYHDAKRASHIVLPLMPVEG
ncbi:MAG: CocE/NonD family hydrolase [Thermomicrobiales bacterium]